MSENEILEHFDFLFNTKTTQHIKLNMPLLESVVEHLCEIPTTPSNVYKQKMEKQIDLSNELYKYLPEEAQKLFEEYKSIREETRTITDTQLFCFGYLFAIELQKECKIIE